MLPAYPYQALLLQCRGGFENDCAAEITDISARFGATGYCRTRPGSGYVEFVPIAGGDLAEMLAELPFSNLIFARQWGACLRTLADLPVNDRISPILAELKGIGELHEVFIEHPDTNEGKELAGFCRKFFHPLRQALEREGIRIGANRHAPRLQLFFPRSTEVFVCLADPGNSSPWPLGIPRLRMPRQAPSRSTLKLDEALLSFLTAKEREARLKPGQTAVDLGAAPGGWTWQLTRRGLKVTAVDNGPMALEAMGSGLVDHLRTDGFKYRPPHPVEWLVCDMVENPLRVTALIAGWLCRGDCREAIFNLKLPMKKRYAMVQECLSLIQQHCADAEVDYTLACKQLYHDREEVTVYIRRR
ncbi:23S rRNA (cytidine(2498)-2'-O)-methyltransferase RlmM [Alkalilimnicola ehrlichii]|nr:23S rRNA (cytidine(2498)-2'-O)-methyltransferase RlmM [Alkalilimnicola ehrlichii]